MCVSCLLHSSVQGHLGHVHVVSWLPDSTVMGRGKGNCVMGLKMFNSPGVPFNPPFRAAQSKQTTFSPLDSQRAVLRESWAWSPCAPRGLRAAWAQCSQEGRGETSLGGDARSQAVSASSETGKKQLSSHRSIWRP